MSRLERYGRGFGPDGDGMDDPSVEEDFEYFHPFDWVVYGHHGDAFIPCTKIA